ncbi:hypothetical protein V6N11_046444 [Hibiscus sabdariffa]|uniref:Secreted protein n=1 Tax=Hibiscus sabdariffa TaxID=183260 RepID=A0ABR2P246_9ROSI
MKFSVACLVSSDHSACGGVLIVNGGVFRALFSGFGVDTGAAAASPPAAPAASPSGNDGANEASRSSDTLLIAAIGAAEGSSPTTN